MKEKSAIIMSFIFTLFLMPRLRKEITTIINKMKLANNSEITNIYGKNLNV